MKDFKIHSNIYKLNIEKGNMLTPRKFGGYILDKEYQSKFNVNFRIGTIYLYEELYGNVNIDEIKEHEILPSCMVITDKSGIQSIIVNCYEIPGEQSEIELRIRFHLGKIYLEKNGSINHEMKYINMFGKPANE